MKADISNLKESTRNVDSYRRCNGFCREITALCPKTGSAIVTARFYYPASVAYCVVWVRDIATAGCGKAGGYGYHKESAALADAFGDIGVTLDGHIGGRGNSAMTDAIEAVARASTGKRKFIIHEAHA